MKENLEIEYKAALPDEVNISEIVKELLGDKFRLIRSPWQKDDYFDTSSKVLFRNGVFVRIRDSKMFEIKYNPDLNDKSHMLSNEYKFQLPLRRESEKDIGDFLIRFTSNSRPNRGKLEEFNVTTPFGLSHFLTISKDRIEYQSKSISIFVDTIADLGSFLEIEVKRGSLRKKIETLLNKYGLQHLTTGYVELYLRKYDYQTYLKGKYLLQGDLAKQSINK